MFFVFYKKGNAIDNLEEKYPPTVIELGNKILSLSPEKQRVFMRVIQDMLETPSLASRLMENIPLYHDMYFGDAR